MEIGLSYGSCESVLLASLHLPAIKAVVVIFKAV